MKSQKAVVSRVQFLNPPDGSSIVFFVLEVYGAVYDAKYQVVHS